MKDLNLKQNGPVEIIGLWEGIRVNQRPCYFFKIFGLPLCWFLLCWRFMCLNVNVFVPIKILLLLLSFNMASNQIINLFIIESHLNSLTTAFTLSAV